MYLLIRSIANLLFVLLLPQYSPGLSFLKAKRYIICFKNCPLPLVLMEMSATEYARKPILSP